MSELLTLDEIAQMHRCTYRHARDVIVKLPGFPKEAPTSTPRNRVWVRTEVRAHVTRKTKQAQIYTPNAHGALRAA